VLPSLSEIRKGIEKLEGQVEEVKAKLATFKIESDEDMAAAIDTRQQAKDIFAAIEGAIEPRVGPAKKIANDANAIIRHYREMLLGDKKKGIAGIVGNLDEKILLHQRKKIIDEQVAQNEREKGLRKAEEEIQKEAEKKGVEAPPALPTIPKAPAAQKTHSTASGAKATIVKRWTFDADFVDFETLFVEALRSIGYTVEKQDPNFTPTEADLVLFRYVMLNGKEINSAIDAGTRQIPGINIYQKEHVR
jgi:hypothetical protein